MEFLKIIFLPFLSHSIRKRAKIIFLAALFFPLLLAIPSYLLSHAIHLSLPNLFFYFILWLAIFYPFSGFYIVFINNLLKLKYKKKSSYLYSIKNILFQILKFKYKSSEPPLLLLSFLLVGMYVYLLFPIFSTPAKSSVAFFIYLYLILLESLLFFLSLLVFAGLQDNLATLISLTVSFSIMLLLLPFFLTKQFTFPSLIGIWKWLLLLLLPVILQDLFLRSRIRRRFSIFARKEEKWSLLFDGRLFFLFLLMYFLFFLFIWLNMYLLISLANRQFLSVRLFIPFALLSFLISTIFIIISIISLKDLPSTLLSFFSSWKKFFDCYSGENAPKIKDENLNKLTKITGKCIGLSFNERYTDFYPLFEQSFWIKVENEILEIIRLRELIPLQKVIREGDTIMAIGFPRKIYDEEKSFRYILEAHYIEPINNLRV